MRGTTIPDLDDLVAALAFARGGGYALLAEAEFLAGLGAGGDLELGAAVDGGDVDLGAESGLGHGDGDGGEDVVGDAVEDGMRAGFDDQEEVAVGASVGAGVALAGEADALAVAGAGLDAELERLAAGDDAGSVAGGAGVGDFTGASAARALDVELHASAHLGDLARSRGTRGTPWRRRWWTCLCRWGKPPGRSISRRVVPPRTAVQKSMETWYSRSVPGWGPRCAAPRPPLNMPEKMSLKEPPKPASWVLPPVPGWPLPRPAAAKSEKSEAAEVEGNLLRGAASSASGGGEGIAAAVLAARGGLGGGGIDGVGVEAELVEDLALLFVGEDVVGFGDLLELFFGLFVAGVYVRVILARELAKGLADLILGGAFFDAQRGVIVFGLSCHVLSLKQQWDEVILFCCRVERVECPVGWFLRSSPLHIRGRSGFGDSSRIRGSCGSNAPASGQCRR